jgi:ABC-type polysaccharide/polyol phosphate export permease
MVPSRQLELAVKDLRDGIASTHIWSTLGWQEIKQRYRRSALGPFWLTISTGTLVAAMGPLYGRLFGQDTGSYLPFLATGFIVWQLIASMINESTQVFIGAEQFIKQIKLPLTVHVMRMVWRNAIVFAHNSVIVFLALAFYLPQWEWTALLALPGLLAILVNGIWAGILLGLFCARFRDIPQIVGSLVTVAFFLTPVLWRHEMLGRHQWAAQLNPLFHLLEVVRAPLLGVTAVGLSWAVVVAMTLVGFFVTLIVFARFRGRIAYWV